MITLGVGELVWSMSLMPEFFGGGWHLRQPRGQQAVLGRELRAADPAVLPDRAVLLRLHRAMFAFAQTPLGRILNAVRDNPERASGSSAMTPPACAVLRVLHRGFAGIAGASGRSISRS